MQKRGETEGRRGTPTVNKPYVKKKGGINKSTVRPT